MAVYKDNYVRDTLMRQRIQWIKERDTLLKLALEAEDYDKKDEFYRKAAVFGIRVDSVDQTIVKLNDSKNTDNQKIRFFQEHMRNMTRLKYRPRPAHLVHDNIDTEVISQFYKDGVPVNNISRKMQ